mmetsp:Transcript_22039/g.24651  ORF Transcript_22039/g.24651 Transcript_22039/m.24651 type:complete len:225 (+) Transcript_22039:89-763(+)
MDSTIQSNNTKPSRKRSRRGRDDNRENSKTSNETTNSLLSSPQLSLVLSGEDDDNNNNKRKKRSHRPLKGMVISVSTLKDNSEKSLDSTSSSYNDVCQSCRNLGADVINLVCKRVTILVCTEAAVKQATQRVRKAIKRKKPLVSVVWVEEVRTQGRLIDFEQYRLDKQAEKSIQNRHDRLDGDKLHDSFKEVIPSDDAGWTEPKGLGYVIRRSRVCALPRLINI